MAPARQWPPDLAGPRRRYQENDHADDRPILEPTEEQRRSVVPVKLGVRVFRELLAALEGMGLDTVDLYLPAAQEEKTADPILFRARGEEAVSVVGCVMTHDGKSPAVRL